MFKNRGSIAVEMVMILMVLSVCLGFATDLSRKTSMQGELDNLSYMAVNLLSERELLFPKSVEGMRPVHSDHASAIHQIIRNELVMQYGSHFDDANYGVRIEGIRLHQIDPKNSKPNLQHHQSRRFGNYTLIGKSQPLEAMVKTAPYTNKNRYAPMYRVTIYYRSQGLFNSVIGNEKKGAVLVSSSFSVGR